MCERPSNCKFVDKFGDILIYTLPHFQGSGLISIGSSCSMYQLHACVSRFSCAQLCVTLWTVAHQALSMGFSRKEYWSGLPCPQPGDLPDPGIKPQSLMSPTLAGRFFTTSATWEAPYTSCLCLKHNPPSLTYEIMVRLPLIMLLLSNACV